MNTAQLEYRSIDRLKPHPDNPKGHDLDAIAESIALWGFVGAIVVDERTGYTLGGHGRVEALQRIRAAAGEPPAGIPTSPSGDWLVPVTPYRTRDDNHARKILVVLNRTTELGGWDDELLAQLLTDLDDLAGTGFTDTDLDGLLADIMDGALGDTTVTDAPSPPLTPDPHVREGQTWQLGRHRLHVGDCTTTEAWGHALGPGVDLVDAMWTDPPYGINVASRRGLGAVSSAEARKLGGATLKGDGDDPEALRDLLASAFGIAVTAVKPGGAWFVAGPSGANSRIFVDEMVRVGAYRQGCVWVKDRLVLGRSDFQYRHEAIYYGWRDGDPRQFIGYRHEDLHYGWTPGGKHAFVDDRTITSVLEYPTPTNSEHHPTMKPVPLIEDTLSFATIGPGNRVVDPFAGSGSTAIAAEHLGATAHLIELDPRWADNLLTRWVEAGGDTPTNLEDGSPFPI